MTLLIFVGLRIHLKNHRTRKLFRTAFFTSERGLSMHVTPIGVYLLAKPYPRSISLHAALVVSSRKCAGIYLLSRLVGESVSFHNTIVSSSAV
jgi:hypothetical protein